MYRAIIPSHWIVTHAMNHETLNSSASSVAVTLPGPPPSCTTTHTAYTVPAATYYTGCMEIVPFVAFDQRKHRMTASSATPLSLEILGLGNAFWNNRGVVMSQARSADRTTNHYKNSPNLQGSVVVKSSRSKQNVLNRDNDEDVIHIKTETNTGRNEQNLKIRTPGSSSLALNNKGIKRRLDVGYKPSDRSPSPSSKTECDVVYIATKRKPQADRNDASVTNGTSNGIESSCSTENDELTVIPRPPKNGFTMPSDLIKGNNWDKLSVQVWNKFSTCKQTDEMFNKKMRLHGVLIHIMQAHYPMCGLYVVGSSMTTFGTNSSDMDMCLMLTASDIDQRIHAINILKDVLKIIKNFDYFVKAELIRAKVPILEFRDSVSGVDVDLNVNNSVGIRNTHLLRAYSNLDWRVSPLVLVVKIWARIHDINDAKNMTISSYSLALMVIHYLQYGVTPPVLPSLQKLFPHKFLPEQDVRELSLYEKFQVPPSTNSQSLGHLLWGFFHYYANVFNFQEDAISVRRGGKIPKHFVKFQSAKKNTPGMWKCLCIEEPFDLTNTARAVYDDDVFRRIKNVFLTSYSKLNRTTDLTSIMFS